MNKPGIPQGTRDFGPDVVRKRNYIFNTIRTVFELYGFQPLETPALENRAGAIQLLSAAHDPNNRLAMTMGAPEPPASALPRYNAAALSAGCPRQTSRSLVA